MSKYRGGQLLGRQRGGGGGRQLQAKNLIRVITCKMCLFSLYFLNYMIFITRNAEKIGATVVYNFVLRKFDFRGR